MRGIRVLLIEDNDVRRSKIVNALCEMGVIRDLLDEVDCVAEARKLLLDKKYDLCIVDIALPNFKRGDIRPYAGADLIDEIFRSDRLFRPTHVIALTGHESLLGEHHDKFKREMVFLLFAGEDGSWLQAISSFVGRLVSSRQDDGGSCVDVAIITAIPATEGKAFMDMNLSWSSPIELDASATYRVCMLEEGQRAVSVALISPINVGLVHASIITTKVVERLRPKLVVMAGICAGIQGVSNVGDVVLASASWEWQTGKYQEIGDEHLAEPNQIPIDDFFIRIFRNIPDGEKGFISNFMRRWKGEQPPTSPRLLSGPFASGSSVLASADLLGKIKKQQRKVLAVDMEVHAVYAACFHASLPRPRFFAVKSVSDLADGNKNDHFHGFCSALSAECALEIIRGGLLAE